MASYDLLRKHASIVICNKTFSVSYPTEFLAKKIDTSMSKTQLNSILLLSTSRKENLTLYTLLPNCAIELVNRKR